MSYNINSNTIVTPTGTIAPYIGNGITDPSGWVICDGASRSNATGQYNNLINAGLINQSSFVINSSTGTGVSTSYLPATNTFNQMATSQNGQLILAGHNTSGYLYLSTNRGNTWAIQNNSLSANWQTVALSATNGQYQLAGSNSFLYLSTNTGSNWLPISGSQYGSTYGLLTTTGNWSSSAISNAGQYMLAGMNTGNLYMSTNSGNSWRLLGGAANTNGMPTIAVIWSSCSMNASGSLMAAAVSTGAIYLSTNSGTNWKTASSLSTSSPWSEVSIASSANYVVAAANSGNIYLSTDGAGATWTQKSGMDMPISVAVGGGTNSLAYSYDGITWIGVGTSLFTEGRGVAWNGSYWFAVGDNVAVKSTDGINWTQVSTSVAYSKTTFLMWANPYWIAGGLSNSLGLTSDGGVTWRTSNVATYTCIQGGSNQLPYPNNLTIVLGTANSFGNGHDQNALHMSTDYFNSYADGPLFINCAAITYANNIWMVASASAGYVYYSTDNSKTYTAGTGLSTLFATQAYSIGYGNGIWIAGGDKSSTSANPLAYSINNGVSWLPSTNGATVFPYNNTHNTAVISVEWTGKYWVAAGETVTYDINYGTFPETVAPANTLAYSLDGITWTGGGKSVFSTYCYSIGWNGNTGSLYSTTIQGQGAENAWQSLAISGDGTDIIAGTSASIIYASTTSGNSWTTLGGSSNVLGLPNAATSNWSSMAISQDGNTWLADVTGAQMYISTDGKGALWGIKSNYNVLGTGVWNALSMSSDGSTVLAGNASSNLFVSYDSGNTYNALSSNGNLSGTKNWTGSAISSNNQIMLASATGDFPYLSSNSGLTWSNQLSTAIYTLPSASTFGKSWSAVQETTYIYIGENWTLLSTSTGLVTSASFYNASMSSTGQFMIAGIYGGATYLSTDYGGNWKATPTGLAASANYTGSSISATGQFMLVSTSTGTNYLSTSYGFSFSTTSTSTLGATESAMSVDGKYMLSANWISVNYGANWAAIAAGTGITTTNVNFWQPAISATGQYMILTSKQSAAGSPVNLSTSYGSFWTQNAISGMSTSAAATGCSISASGQFMVVLVLGGSTYLSSTYGQNWVQTPGTGLAASANYYSATMSSSGQYILIGGNAGTVNSAALSYFSSNYGANWLSAVGTPTQSYGISVAMSSNGQYMLNVGYGNAGVYISTAIEYIASSLNVATNWKTLGTTNGLLATAAYVYSASAISGNGKYIVATTNTVYLSSNYGNNFTTLPSGTITGNYRGAAISYTGQVIFLAINNGNLYLSTNYGINFTANPGAIGTNSWQTVSMSFDGKYLFAGYGTSYPYLSSNGGASFKLLSSNGLPNGQSNWGSAVSYTGQYILSPFANGSGTFYLSSNYGISFFKAIADIGNYNYAAVSQTGQYMFTHIYFSSNVYISSSYGVYWSTLSQFSSANFYGISMTLSGQYMGAVLENGNIYLSSSYGVYWNIIPNLSANANICFSATGHYAIANTNNGAMYLSTLTGLSAQPLSSNGPAVSFQQEITGYTLPTFLKSYYQIFPTNYGLTINNVANQLSSLKLSQTGQYIVVVGYQKTYISSTTGNNFFETFHSNSGTAGMSYDGKYIVIGNANTYVYVSSNFGVNFTQITLPGSSTPGHITVSGNGKYMLVTSDTKIFLSNNYGVSFSLLTSSTGISTSASWTPPAISNDGQYMFVSHRTSGVGHYISSNYGSNWIVTSIPNTFTSNGPSTMSSSGQYMVAHPFVGNFYFSSTFGKSFYSPINPSFSPASYLAFTGAYMDQTGQYTILSNHGGSIVYSTNHGATFLNMLNPAYSIVSNTGNPLCNMSGDGLITFITGNQGSSTSWYVSTTYASSYTGTATSTLTSPAVVPNPYWFSVTTDATGQYVVVGSIMNQGIWYSSDFANTWQTSNQNVGTVQQLANSGTYMLAAINNLPGIYYSSNYGAWWQGAATPNSANYICVSMSSSSTYAVAGSIGGGVVYSSTYGQTWQSSNFTTGTFGAVATSSTGQYGLASNSTTIYYSTNFGQTFIASSLTTVNAQSLAISQTGQYAVTGTTTGIYYSNNYGQTWSQATGSASTGTWYGINIMSSGQYVVAGNAGQGLWYSLNFGQTWTQSTTNTTDTWYEISTTPSGSYLYAVSQSTTIYQETNVTAIMTLSANGLPTAGSSWQTAAMDSTGQYQLLGINNGFLYYTNNFGNAWSTISGQSPMTQLYNSGNGLPTIALAWSTSSMNSTGQYALAGINGGALYMTTNTATSWTPISGLGPLGATGPWLASNYGMTTNSLAWQTTSMNSTGQYMLAGSNNNFLYLSTNSGTYWAIIGGSAYGSTFSQGLPTVGGAWYASAVSSTGQYMATGLYGSAFYFSRNYGKAWQAITNSPLTSAMNWKSMSMAANGTAIVASVNNSNVYTMTTFNVQTATYTPPQIGNTTSTDGTGLKYIIKL